MKFKVTENTLHTNDEIKYLSITNGIYDMVISYYGNYDDDKAVDQINKNMTLVMCKSDGLHPEIKYVAGHICIGIPIGELLYVHRVDKYKQYLDDAKASAIALAEILKEYGFTAELTP